MLKESKLFTLLDKVLNQSAHVRKGEEAVYFCPFCSHRKKKLEINVRTQEWHCWICNARGSSIRSLFYKLNTIEFYINELYKIVGNNWKIKDNNQQQEINFCLPDEFIPLWKRSDSSNYGLSMAYLHDRNVNMDDIIRYNIGYCDGGIYNKRILIPSFDKTGNINFFSARTFNSVNNYKYMLSPWPKNIIGFELFINWDLPISLVEGTFDAIAVRNNVIPLFGTTLTFDLKLALVTNKVKKINIILDNDALSQAIDIYDRIEDLQVNDIDIRLVKLGEKDPSVLGFEAVTEIIENTKAFDFTDLIKTRLETK